MKEQLETSVLEDAATAAKKIRERLSELLTKDASPVEKLVISQLRGECTKLAWKWEAIVRERSERAIATPKRPHLVAVGGHNGRGK